MSRIPNRQGSSRADVLAYGCAASAIVFIFALTFGAMDGPEPQRTMAYNAESAAPSATP